MVVASMMLTESDLRRLRLLVPSGSLESDGDLHAKLIVVLNDVICISLVVPIAENMQQLIPQIPTG